MTCDQKSLQLHTLTKLQMQGKKGAVDVYQKEGG